jgi:hypothetical protein
VLSGLHAHPAPNPACQTCLPLYLPLQRAVPDDTELRKLLGALVVIAANAGGAWTPIGDVTTTVRPGGAACISPASSAHA